MGFLFRDVCLHIKHPSMNPLWIHHFKSCLVEELLYQLMLKQKKEGITSVGLKRRDVLVTRYSYIYIINVMWSVLCINFVNIIIIIGYCSYCLELVGFKKEVNY